MAWKAWNSWGMTDLLTKRTRVLCRMCSQESNEGILLYGLTDTCYVGKCSYMLL